MANFNLADYETVDSRIKRFYADFPGGRISTELVDYSGEVGKTRWVVKASVWRQVIVTSTAAGIVEHGPDGTGYAFENDGEGMANRTSALENCETSAIGRALANIGYSGDKRASREEMVKAKPDAAEIGTPPEGWRDRIDNARSPEALQEYYESEARHWFTDEVKLAFTSRKKVLAAKADL